MGKQTLGQGLRDGKSSFPFDPSKKEEKPNLENKEIPLFFWMLHLKRDFVIKEVKNPLRRALENGKSFKKVMKTMARSVGLLPKITKKNTSSPAAHILIDIRDELLAHHVNVGREKMVKSACDLAIEEIEHDEYWSFLMHWVAIKVALAIIKGDFKPQSRQFPPELAHSWTGGDLPDYETIKKMALEYLLEGD